MTCNCITEIDNQLERQKLDVSILWGRDSNAMIAVPAIFLVRKDNGRRETRRGQPSVFRPIFCPFCGVRYEAEAAE